MNKEEEKALSQRIRDSSQDSPVGSGPASQGSVSTTTPPTAKKQRVADGSSVATAILIESDPEDAAQSKKNRSKSTAYHGSYCTCPTCHARIFEEAEKPNYSSSSDDSIFSGYFGYFPFYGGYNSDYYSSSDY